MAITYTWSVKNLERNLSDGGITRVHWECNGTETVGSGDDAVTYVALRNGTTGHSYDAADPSFIAFDDVTEENAISWAKAAIDPDAIESAIEASITKQKTPTTGSGVPW